MPPTPSSSVATLDRRWTAADAAAVRPRPLTRTLVPALIALVTVAVFVPALHNAFVDWDDSILIVKNEHYRGLGWPQIRWMFGNVLMGHYVPVTWLTLGLDYVLWGMDPAGYHFTNLVLHAANAALFYLLALRLLRAATDLAPGTRSLAATASALFFALHPLRAESVAWATERRDVLSGFFFFLTLLFYLDAREREGRARIVRHAAAAVCYLAAILSKSIVMTLPVLLILLDVYPFRRLDHRPRTWMSAAVWREKFPYIALGALAVILGYYAQAANAFITSTRQIPWSSRPALIAYSVAFYVEKTLAPVNLSPLYELPSRIDPLAARFLVPLVAVAAAVIGLARFRRRWPALVAVAASYLLLLSPVMGVVHSGHQLAHDRYSYLACLGWAVLVGAAVGWLEDARARGLVRPALVAAGRIAVGAWLLALAFLTWHQVGTWRDTETLWRYAVESSPDCSVCELNLGSKLLNDNLLALAIPHFERALERRPDRVRIHHNIGLALARQGEVARAVPHFERVVEDRPTDASALMNLGVSLMKLGRAEEGIVYLRRAAEVTPDDVLVLSNLGTALAEAGRAADGVELFRRAIVIDPAAPQPRFALVKALVARGDLAGARREHTFLRVVDPAAANFIGPALVDTW